MRPSRVIHSTFLVMLIVQAIGTTDSQHRLPSPKNFVPVFVLWGVLFLAAGTQFGRLAARLSVLVLLTGMILGPFGQTLIGFFTTITDKYTAGVYGGSDSGTFGGGGDFPTTGQGGGKIA